MRMLANIKIKKIFKKLKKGFYQSQSRSLSSKSWKTGQKGKIKTHWSSQRPPASVRLCNPGSMVVNAKKFSSEVCSSSARLYACLKRENVKYRLRTRLFRNFKNFRIEFHEGVSVRHCQLYSWEVMGTRAQHIFTRSTLLQFLFKPQSWNFRCNLENIVFSEKSVFWSYCLKPKLELAGCL